ncbi:hypothetical protein D3C72_1511070 [compost metagenome]
MQRPGRAYVQQLGIPLSIMIFIDIRYDHRIELQPFGQIYGKNRYSPLVLTFSAVDQVKIVPKPTEFIMKLLRIAQIPGEQCRRPVRTVLDSVEGFSNCGEAFSSYCLDDPNRVRTPEYGYSQKIGADALS